MTTLADGRVSDTQTAILVSIGNAGRAFEKITFTNVAGSSSSPETVRLFLNRALGGIRFLRQWKLTLNETADYLEPGEALSIARDDSLEAVTTTDNVIDFLITGTIG